MKQFAFFSLILFFVACSPNEADQKTTAELIGDWKGVDWLVFGKPADFDVSTVRFSFDSEGNYTAAYGEQKERGTFRVRKDKLYTTDEQKLEKVVRIKGTVTDTLKLEMNRMGQDETLVLIRQ